MIARDYVVRMSKKAVDNVLSCLMDHYKFPSDFVFFFVQHKFSKESSDNKKPGKRAPAKLLDSEGPPARGPTRHVRIVCRLSELCCFFLTLP